MLLVFPVSAAAAAAARAKPAPAPVKAVEKAQPATNAEVAISLDDLKTLLARKETPRISVTNNFGGAVTGRAVGIEGGKLQIDVSAEGIGISGVMGVPLPSIVSIKALVPQSEKEVEAAKAASQAYLASLASTPPAAEGIAGTESSLAEGVASTESAVATVPSTESALAVPEAEGADQLATYPPKEGWGPKRLGEIVRKAVVLHLEPAGKDKTFMRDYEAWKTAYEHKRDTQLEELAALQGMNKPVPADFQVLPELEPVPALEGAPNSSTPDAPVGNDSDGAPSPGASEPTGK
jgi:hypothetical protein